jgi:hypothetical protein
MSHPEEGIVKPSESVSVGVVSNTIVIRRIVIGGSSDGSPPDDGLWDDDELWDDDALWYDGD